MMSHWISGTPVKIERTSVWKTWSIGSELKLWSLKVCCSASSHLRASLFSIFYSIFYNLICVCQSIFSIWFSSPGGFAQSELMSGHLIDFFVPFLPLEYRHVKLCARDAYAARGLETDEATLDEVAKAMLYVPKEERLFSAQGCKSIPQRINFFLP